MVTTAIITLKKGSKQKSMYVHGDGYPSRLGSELKGYLQSLTSARYEALVSNFSKVKWVYERDVCKSNVVEALEDFGFKFNKEFKKAVAKNDRDITNYWVFREYQGVAYLRLIENGVPYMMWSNPEFDHNYEYLIDFDEKTMKTIAYDSRKNSIYSFGIPSEDIKSVKLPTVAKKYIPKKKISAKKSVVKVPSKKNSQKDSTTKSGRIINKDIYQTGKRESDGLSKYL